jgi:glycosyltransferase involved in cell wall biosynthesis
LLESGHSVDVLTQDDGDQPYTEGTVVRLRFGPGLPPSPLLHKSYVLEARSRRWCWPEYGPYLRRVLGCLRQPGISLDLVIVANDPELAWRLNRKGMGRRQVLWLHNQLQGKEARRLSDLPPGVSVVAVSDSVRMWTSETYGIPKSSISVIHNGIDLDEFHPRADFDQPRRDVHVVSHGRIDPNKGHDIAAKAVALLRRKGYPVTFTMVGGVQTYGISGAQASAYADQLAAAIAEAEGTATGRLPASAVPEVLRDHDIACVLSKSAEPFSLAALEAMASGCAVITTGTGGIREVVGDAADFVGVDDVEAVAAAIEALLVDPDLLSERKRSGLIRSKSFTWDKAASKVESLMVGVTS